MRFRFESRTAIVAALLLAALGLRIWTVLALRHDPRIAEPVIDGKLYLQTARAIASGTFDWQTVFFQSPLYPLVLGSLFRIAPPAVVSIQIFQSFVGLASGLLLYLAVRRWMGSTVALATLALWLLYGPIVEMESELVPATLLLFLTTVALWTWPRASDGPRAVAFGIISGLLIVGSGTFALLPLLAALGILLGLREASASRARWVSVAWMGAGLLLAVSPFSIHQSRESGGLLLLTPNSGLNLYLGNNPAARGIYSNPPELEIEQDFTGVRSASRLAGSPLTLVESSNFWRDRALAFFREAPSRAAWLWGRKVLLYLSPREIPQIENFSRIAADAIPLRVSFLRFGWILPFAVLGSIVLFRSKRGPSPGQRSSASRGEAVPFNGFPFLALIATGWIATLAFFAAGRFRIPIVPGFLALAAIGVIELWRTRTARRRLVIGSAIVVAVATLQFLLPSYPVARADANADYLLGLRLAQRDDHEGAITIFQRALERDPSYGEAWHGIGVSLSEQRRFEEAVDAYRQALQRMPGSTWTHYNLGLCLEQTGRHPEAARAFGDAVALQPNDPNLRYRLGASLAQLGNTAEAIEQLEIALQLDPSQSAAAQLLSRIR